jgi:hypothetical protein
LYQMAIVMEDVEGAVGDGDAQVKARHEALGGGQEEEEAEEQGGLPIVLRVL